uniref:CUB domain-containing protein n=1 Tax=Acrobeloides nanus TaxID=290746 RepID=A0A914CY22_9BILA
MNLQEDSDMAMKPSYANNSDCIWQLDLTAQNIKININPTNLNAVPSFPEGKFSITTPQRTQPYIINLTTDPCTLQTLLYDAVNRESPTWVIIRFQSSNNVPATGAYFDWTINSISSAPPVPSCQDG